MTYRLFGALLLTAGCGGLGLFMNCKRRHELSMLKQLHCFIDNLICDLRYRQAPLHQLIRSDGTILGGELYLLLEKFASELEAQIAPDASCCMAAAIGACPNIPGSIRNVLHALGQSFGRYDIDGQIRCLESVLHNCKKDYTYMEDKLGNYTRCCQAYSLGAGAILALILL